MWKARGVLERKTLIRSYVTTRSLNKRRCYRAAAEQEKGRERGTGAAGARGGGSPGGVPGRGPRAAAACLVRTRLGRPQGSCRYGACMGGPGRAPQSRGPGGRAAESGARISALTVDRPLVRDPARPASRGVGTMGRYANPSLPRRRNPFELRFRT